MLEIVKPTEITRLDTSILAGLVSETTKELYRQSLSLYMCHAITPERAIQPATLAEWRTRLVEAGYSPNTINRHIDAIKRIVREGCARGFYPAEIWLAFDQIERVSIAAMKERLKSNSRTKITPADMRRLCDSPDTRKPAGLMHRALLLTLASSGVRASEATGLKISSIEEREGGYIISVIGKTDITPRQAPLSKEAYAAIQSWLSIRTVQSEYVFTGFAGRGNRQNTTPITAKSAWQIVTTYAAACGLSNIKTHDFRRFVGTMLGKDNVRTAQKALGHKRAATTLDNYVLDELEVGVTEGLF